MAKYTYTKMAQGYKNMWASMSVNAGADKNKAVNAARKVIDNKARYKAVEVKTGVPWFWIGAVHYREASNSFRGVLHNGEHIIGTGRKTRLVPAGRGPFSSWEEAAVDALRLHNLHHISDWNIARLGYEAERFNGFGYARKGVNSPYVWAGTNHEQGGMYVADHVFSYSAHDARVGTMAIIKQIAAIDAEVAIKVYETPKLKADKPKPKAKPSVAKKAVPVAVAVGTAAAANEAGWNWWEIGLGVVVAVVAVMTIVYVIGKVKGK